MFTRIKFYAGIGSRETPLAVCNEMVRLGYELAPYFTLRSGAADGADAAFECGAVKGGGSCEIYLPKPGFNDHPSKLYSVTQEAFALAATLHPVWDELPLSWRHMHARNCYQILGQQLQDPVDLVVCWTKDGCESARTRRSTTGGTATAIVLAERNKIPVFNLQNVTSRERLVEHLLNDVGLDVSWLLQGQPHRQVALF